MQATVQHESPPSEALQTEAADAVLADDGTLDPMQLDPACGSVQANPAVTARGTTTDDHPGRSQLPHAAAAVTATLVERLEIALLIVRLRCGVLICC